MAAPLQDLGKLMQAEMANIWLFHKIQTGCTNFNLKVLLISIRKSFCNNYLSYFYFRVMSRQFKSVT